ncbi:GTPase [Massilia sp. DWR3-1-1]|uniref:GTPase n=1 Tax=Massilia sp. DWR3-1-1 TaxID=2804559 RepID=UPI003CE9154E
MLTTLVTGASAAAREQAIAAAAPPGAAILLEGMPSGHTILPDHLGAVRIAPGCLCCSGNLVLRVTLNRIMRRRPARLFIGLASTEHLDQLRSWLLAPPYDQLLALTPDLSS